MDEKVTKEQLTQLTTSMGEVVGAEGEGKELMDSIATLLALPDEQFELLAPGILQSYAQTFNNPNDKLALVQTLNATGYKAEDVNAAFNELVEAVDKMDLPVAKRNFLKQMFGFIIGAINETEGISKRYIPVAIELCHPDAKIPQYAHISDSGVDVYAVEDITIHPGETVLVPTGIKVGIPAGYELQVRPKSGRTLKTKLRIANTPGTIDQEYRDEVKVIIENVEAPIKDITYYHNADGSICIESILHGADAFISKGEKFCQLVLAETPKISFYRVDNILDIEGNRNGGFGSTDAPKEGSNVTDINSANRA